MVKKWGKNPHPLKHKSNLAWQQAWASSFPLPASTSVLAQVKKSCTHSLYICSTAAMQAGYLHTQPEVGGPHAPGRELAQPLHPCTVCSWSAGPWVGLLQGELRGLQGSALPPHQTAGGLQQVTQARVGLSVSPTDGACQHKGD